MVKKVQLLGYRCERCNHEWLPRKKDETPKVCPKCKSPYWGTPRDKFKAANAETKSKPVVE